MTRRLRTIFTLAFCLLALPCALHAQKMEWTIEPLTEEGGVWIDYPNHKATGTNGVLIKYAGAVLTADRVTADWETGDVTADGDVRIQRDNQVWASEHIRYNFKTRDIEAAHFRTGKPPVYAAGEGLHAEWTNNVYAATNVFITTEDIANPPIKLRAKYVKITSEKIEAHQATLYIEGVPVFFFPYFSRNLGPRSNNFNFVPGYRSSFGPYLLSSYTWYINERLDAVAHVDYRERRGPGLGPDLNYHLNRWGDGTMRYYYTHDENPNLNNPGGQIPEDRQRVYFAYQANPFTNLTVKSMVRYQTDTNIVREFFESEYRENPQPSTYLDVNRFWQNFSLDAYAQPRVNNFLETVERLPELRLTGFRQELGYTPFYYESQSSAGYYQRLFPETNSMPSGLDFAASRADTFHQILLPLTFFGWLNVIPRVGGRATYYSEATGPGAITDQEFRGVFNTGAEVNFKASRLWPSVQEDLFEVDGLRHIIQPSANYVFVPTPTRRPPELPQFDYELPSLRLLPIDFPDYNSIDSIDSQNVVRLGLNNKLQTKRQGQVANLLNWDLYTDWRLHPRSDQTTFADLFSDAVVKPRSWLTLESLLRYDLNDGLWRMAFNTVTFQPNDVWSWGVGHFYLRDDLRNVPTALGIGNNLFTSTLFYRLNENWGFRASQRFEARDGRMEEQAYTVYRDLRSWTAALTFRVLENNTGQRDYTVAFTFSLKAFPRFGLNSDIVRPSLLLGE